MLWDSKKTDSQKSELLDVFSPTQTGVLAGTAETSGPASSRDLILSGWLSSLLISVDKNC